MTILFDSSFEDPAFAEWDVHNDMEVVTTPTPVLGTHCARLTAYSADFIKVFGGNNKTVYARIYVRFHNLETPLTNAPNLFYLYGVGTDMFTVYLWHDGYGNNVLNLYSSDLGNDAGSIPIESDVWYCIEVKAEFAYLGTTSISNLWLDGNLECTLTGNNDHGNKPITTIELVPSGKGFQFDELYFDALEVNTARINCSPTIYTGGPYSSVGFATLLSACSIGPINIPYSRVTAACSDIMERLFTNFIPWEWWFDYTGKFNMGIKRGTDKSASIALVAGDKLNKITAERKIGKTTQRVKITGSGESGTQDEVTSDWKEDTNVMTTIKGFYESIESERDISDKAIADIIAQVRLALNKDPREEITLEDFDNAPYTANNYDLGDEITATDADTKLAGKYRIKTIEKTIDPDGGETPKLTLSNKKTDVSDRLTELQRRLDKIQNSNTTIDLLLNIGGKQTKLNPDKMEDVWQITASNKDFFNVPEEHSEDDPNIVFTVVAGAGSYRSDKDQFYVRTNGSIPQDDLDFYDTLLTCNWEDDPRFTCEVEIDTNAGGLWANNDSAYIMMWNAARTRGIGFNILLAGAAFHLYVMLYTQINGMETIDVTSEITGGINYDTKIKLEARVDWDEKIIRYYVGTPSYDSALIGVFPMPLTEPATGQGIYPVWVKLITNGVNIRNLVIYNYRAQKKGPYHA
jgi:hypothetical protein